MIKDEFLNEDERIQEKLKQKTWNEIRTNDSWAIFKVMAEFVNGYETMARIVHVFLFLARLEQNQTTNIIN
jgi:hypothetical protein